MIKIEKNKWIFNKDYIQLYRRFTVREYARIQTFPDTFKLVYENIIHGYKMIGNAVTVNLAFNIACNIKQSL